MEMRAISTAWVVVLVSMWAARADAEAPTEAALAERAAALEARLGRGFTVLVEPPFVLVGDEPAKKVRRRAATVRWTRTLLMRDFFADDPDRVLEVWLFRNEKTYRRWARELFGDEPTTPYGYYSSARDALVMNIGPGAGTLVHELVHPYMEANFPEVPAWFNEGLASLYERPREVKGHITGVPNWRLPALQREIKAGRGRTLPALLASETDEFYDAGDEVYARARYLCYYLQERGLLVAFYRKFLETRAEDPTGLAALESVLGRKVDDDLEQEFATFVLELRVGK